MAFGAAEQGVREHGGAGLLGCSGRLEGVRCLMGGQQDGAIQRSEDPHALLNPRVADQPPNGRASWPVMAAVRRAGGGLGAKPWLAMSRAMASGVVAASTQRMGPPQRAHVSRSSANTCWNSHAHLLRDGRRSVLSSSVFASNKSWSPGAGGGRDRGFYRSYFDGLDILQPATCTGR